jgi:hypothetical protein
MEIIELWPSSQGEIEGTADRFVDTVLAHGPRITTRHAAPPRLPCENRRRGLPRGGAAYVLPPRAAFFNSYLSTIIERDVLEIASIERHGDLLKLLALLAAHAGKLLVPAGPGRP